MPRNIAVIGRQELEAHRRFMTGITETDPRLEQLDTANPPAEVWVIDVFVGLPGDEATPPDEEYVLKSVPIALYAREHVTEEGQPVLLERSKQGRLTVVGRTFTVRAGFHFGDVVADNLHIRKVNYSALRLGWLPDMDYTLEETQDDPTTLLQAVVTEPLQVVKGFDAFGDQVFGPGVTSPPTEIQELLAPKVQRETKARHRVMKPAKLGPKGDPEAMNFGVSELQPTIRTTVTTVLP